MNRIFNLAYLLPLTIACGGSGKVIVQSDTNTDDTDIVDTDTADTIDTSTTDTGSTDTADTTDTEPEVVPITCDIGWTFTAPVEYEFFRAGDTIDAVVQVDALDDYTGYTIQWENRGGEIIGNSTIDAEGLAIYSGTDFSAVKGLNRIYARLITPDAPCDTTVHRILSVCDGYILEDFTTESTNWVTRGDAYWDPSGWVEMTGTGQGKKGAVYNKVESIASGTASIRFTIKTGNGMNGGADGFAFTIINVANVTDLDNWISQARSGGGMGYAIGGNSGTFTGDALTVEIDTWHNTYNGTNEFQNDPTTSSHIALTRNADPDDHIVYYDTPNVEDFQPHDIRVDVIPNSVRVNYDGTEVINENPQLTFKGGQMFFSGSTGWATNNHIFDNLEIYHDCQ